MKPLSIILAIATITLVASQLLCGFWLASKGATPEGKTFHRKLGLGASAAALSTAVMTIVLSI
jgi:hypothetical protein